MRGAVLGCVLAAVAAAPAAVAASCSGIQVRDCRAIPTGR